MFLPQCLILVILTVSVYCEPQFSSPIYEDSSNFEPISSNIDLHGFSQTNRPRRNSDESNDHYERNSRSQPSTKGRGDSCEGVYCHPNARCHNGRCHCEFGYEGDAKHNCDKVDLCKKLGCHAFARCYDGRCRCDAGYSGDGYRECIRADSASSSKGISLSDVTTVSPDPSVKGQTPPQPSTKGKGQSSSQDNAQVTEFPELLPASNASAPDMFVGLPYSIDLLSFIPHPPAGDEFSNVYSTDGGASWINYNSPRRPLPAPLPIRTVFPTSYIPRELIHPISFMVDFAPYERTRPGRSFLLSRVDRHGRLRFAVALNQWGNHGEYMELWIHHDNFFTARYDPVMGLQYSGGLMPSTGIATIPLPRAEPGTQKSIKISLEMSDRDLQVFNGCPRDENRIFSLYYSPRQEMNLGKGPAPPAVSAKGKGQTDNNAETNDLNQDKIYLLSGGPVHNNRYKGLVRDMKLFYSRDGASRHCNFQLDQNQGSSSNSKGPSNVFPAPTKGNSYDSSSSSMTPRSVPARQPSYYQPSNPPSQFMGLNFDQSVSTKGQSESSLCVRVNPMKGDTVKLVKIPCN